jgi:A/G-specific adenine glycosylase
VSGNPSKPAVININPADFCHALIGWFRENARTLPWRKTDRWYPVFLSEYLLQQTRIEQAVPYYKKIIAAYPDITKLAGADEQELLTLWSGLGYYNRARNMLKTAKEIIVQFDGNFPKDIDEALQLPGIGKYTAAAILSIAFRKPHALVDGNVIRVITRVFSITEDVRKQKTVRLISDICHYLIDKKRPGDFNEALMELGALICKPQNAACSSCPLKEFCRSSENRIWQIIPFKSPPPVKKKRMEIALLYQNGNKLIIAQRSESGLLASMWEFPSNPVENLPFNQEDMFGEIDYLSPVFRHTYSHIQLFYQGAVMNTEFDRNKWNRQFSSRYQQYRELLPEDISKFPIHNAHKKLLKWYLA